MYFQGTTASLFGWVAQYPLERETALAELLIGYERQLETQEQPDQALLAKAETVLQDRLQAMPLDQELVHLADALYGHLQRYEHLRKLLMDYRAQGLPSYEEAWAWWRMNDCLALQRRCLELLEQQRRLVQWALETLPAEHCLALMNDATQALCWLRVQQQEAWFALFADLMARVQPDAHNREDRFLSLRTALLLTLQAKGANQAERAHALLEALYHLLQEEPGWEPADDFLLETQAMHLEVLQALGETAALRQRGQAATRQVNAWIRKLNQPSLAQRRQLRRLCHNLAASLYAAQQYDLAIPLLQQAIAYGSTTPHSYLWLAACLWATHKNRAEVMALLEQAQAHDASGTLAQQIRRLPELEDLHPGPLLEHADSHSSCPPNSQRFNQREP